MLKCQLTVKNSQGFCCSCYFLFLNILSENFTYLSWRPPDHTGSIYSVFPSNSLGFLWCLPLIEFHVLIRFILPSDPFSFPQPPSYVAFNTPNQGQFALAWDSQVWRSLHLKHNQLTEDRENWPLQSQLLTSVNSFTAAGMTSCSMPLSKLEFGLTWTCTDLLHDLTTSVCLYVHQTCYVQMTVFLYTTTNSASYIPSAPSPVFHNDTWAYRIEGMVYMLALFRAEHCVGPYSLYFFQLLFSMIFTLYCK